jgi:hypothetical protein
MIDARIRLLFIFLLKDLYVKSFETGYQTLSLLSLFHLTRATKHSKISEVSLARYSLYELRLLFSTDTGYQTHPKCLLSFFVWILCRILSV